MPPKRQPRKSRTKMQMPRTKSGQPVGLRTMNKALDQLYEMRERKGSRMMETPLFEYNAITDFIRDKKEELRHQLIPSLRKQYKIYEAEQRELELSDDYEKHRDRIDELQGLMETLLDYGTPDEEESDNLLWEDRFDHDAPLLSGEEIERLYQEIKGYEEADNNLVLGEPSQEYKENKQGSLKISNLIDNVMGDIKRISPEEEGVVKFGSLLKKDSLKNRVYRRAKQLTKYIEKLSEKSEKLADKYRKTKDKRILDKLQSNNGDISDVQAFLDDLIKEYPNALSFLSLDYEPKNDIVQKMQGRIRYDMFGRMYIDENNFEDDDEDEAWERFREEGRAVRGDGDELEFDPNDPNLRRNPDVWRVENLPPIDSDFDEEEAMAQMEAEVARLRGNGKSCCGGSYVVNNYNHYRTTPNDDLERTLKLNHKLQLERAKMNVYNNNPVPYINYNGTI